MVISKSAILPVAITVLGLTGCGAIPTQWMANGYRYHDSTPLSSPAPSRPWLDEAARPDLNALGDQTAAWQGAVYELIAPLPGQLPPGSTTFTLRTTPPATPADIAFDHYLRQGLMSYGYTINPTAENTGTVLVYDAMPLTNKANVKLAKKKLGKQFVEAKDMRGMYYLTLDARDMKGNILSQQAAIGVFPHDKSEYARWPGFGSQPVQGRGYPRPIYETRE